MDKCEAAVWVFHNLRKVDFVSESHFTVRMPSDRCVVQGCSNRSNLKAGISIHNSPINPAHRAKWKKCILLHRKNFNPEGRFAVCSDHFESSCFARQFHMEGSVRRLSPGSVPTIWKAREAPLTDRERRRVSCQTLHFAMNFDIRLKSSIIWCYFSQSLKEILESQEENTKEAVPNADQLACAEFAQEETEEPTEDSLVQADGEALEITGLGLDSEQCDGEIVMDAHAPQRITVRNIT